MSNNYQEIENYRIFTQPAEVHKSVNSLIGMLEGIKLDSIVNEMELEKVINWCNLQRRFERKFPFSEIIPMIESALSVGILTEEEIQDILWLCNRISVQTDEMNSISSLMAILSLNRSVHRNSLVFVVGLYSS